MKVNAIDLVKKNASKIAMGAIGLPMLIVNALAAFNDTGNVENPSDAVAAVQWFLGSLVSQGTEVFKTWPYSLIPIIILSLIVIAIGVMLLMKIKKAAGGSKN